MSGCGVGQITISPTRTVTFVGQQHVTGTGTAFENAAGGTGTVVGTITGTMALGSPVTTIAKSTFTATLSGSYERTLTAATFTLEGTVTVIFEVDSIGFSETVSTPVFVKVAGPAIPTEWTPSPPGIPGVDAYINKAVLVSAVGANAL